MAYFLFHHLFLSNQLKIHSGAASQTSWVLPIICPRATLGLFACSTILEDIGGVFAMLFSMKTKRPGQSVSIGDVIIDQDQIESISSDGWN
jgi:hypothetical protein